MSISELLSTTNENPREESFCAQLQEVRQRETKGGKPYLEWTIADSTGNLTLKIWNNHPQFESANEIDPETFHGGPRRRVRLPKYAFTHRDYYIEPTGRRSTRSAERGVLMRSDDLDDVPGQGRWQIHGIGLPDDVLKKVYADNARRILLRDR